MKLKDYVFEVVPKSVLYELARRGLISPPKPIVLTYSVTAACRSLCRTCNIGRFFLENPDLARLDLSLEEVEKVFRSMGYISQYLGGRTIYAHGSGRNRSTRCNISQTPYDPYSHQRSGYYGP